MNMFCPQCGAEVSQHMGECSQCGATINNNYDKNIKHPNQVQVIALGKGLKKAILQQYDEKVVENEINMPLVGLRGLLKVFFLIISRPIESSTELYRRLEIGLTIVYGTLMILLNVITGYVLFEQVIKRLIESTYDIWDYFLGYGTIQYIIEEIGFTVCGDILILELTEVILLVGMVSIVYRYLFKQNIEWIESIQLQLMPFTIKFLGRIFVFGIALVSVKVAGILLIILVLLLMILNSIQMVSRLGVNRLIVYTLPTFYLLVEVVRMGVVFLLIRGYL